MKDLIKQLGTFRGEACVSIMVRTHRTHPDNQQDALALKNLLKEAETRLSAEYSADVAAGRMAKLNRLASQVDHQKNLEGLVLFANADVAQFHQLPVDVQSRVVIDETFATRDLVRAKHEQANFYALVVSRRNARLIKAHSEHVDAEVGEPFPIENESLFSTNKHQLTMAKGTDQLHEEFFSQVDKVVQNAVKEDPAPVILCTEERNRDHYLKVSSGLVIAGHLNMNRDDEPAHAIVKEAWPIMKSYVEKTNSDRLSELSKAVSQQKFLSDLGDIWRAVNEGRGRTVFVERGYFQPARLDGDAVVPVESPNGSDVVDDIVDEIVERTMQNGGEAVFMNGNDLEAFHGIALITRY